MRCDCLGVLSTSNTYRSFIYCPHFDSMLGLPRLESDCENLYPNIAFVDQKKEKEGHLLQLGFLGYPSGIGPSFAFAVSDLR